MTANIITYSTVGNGNQIFWKKYNELVNTKYGSSSEEKKEFIQWTKKQNGFRVIEVLPNETIEEVLEGVDYYSYIVIYTL